MTDIHWALKHIIGIFQARLCLFSLDSSLNPSNRTKIISLHLSVTLTAKLFKKHSLPAHYTLLEFSCIFKDTFFLFSKISLLMSVVVFLKFPICQYASHWYQNNQSSNFYLIWFFFFLTLVWVEFSWVILFQPQAEECHHFLK